jgi:hypothetical protein
MDDEDSYIHEGLEMSRGRRPVCLLLPVSRVAESASSFDAQERRARRRRRTVGPAVDPEKERRHAVGGIERRFVNFTGTRKATPYCASLQIQPRLEPIRSNYGDQRVRPSSYSEHARKVLSLEAWTKAEPTVCSVCV